MHVLDRILERTAEGLKYLAAALLLLVAVLIAVDVGLRTVANRPIIGVAEVVANGVVAIAFLQLAYTVRIGAMLRSDLLASAVGPKGKAVLESTIALLGCLFFGLVAWASWDPMMRSFERGEFEGYASMQVPTWPIKSLIVVCSILAVVNYAARIWRVWAIGADADRPGQSGTV